MPWEDLNREVAGLFGALQEEQDYIVDLVLLERSKFRIKKAKKKRIKPIKICVECGEKWIPEVHVGRPSDCCSEACKIIRAARTKREGRACGFCQKWIDIPKRRQLYCSVRCYVDQGKKRRRTHGRKEASQGNSGEGGQDAVPTGTDEGSQQAGDGRAPVHGGDAV